MKTKKQKELIDSFLLMLGAENESLYREIILYLSDLGYNPKKDRSNISFKHNLHNKQIVKIGIRGKKDPLPFFALRFSGCKGYSQRFVDVVHTATDKFPNRTPKCLEKECDYCAGNPDTHVYTHTFPDGKKKSHCGAYALEILAITFEDLAEIKRLIQEEHDYLLKHEVSTV
ncbi:hypothetical protein [Enterococcus sp. AZ072]|uniref:hypothetical protein n=1 Tax=unclassified Enterococcus TaxID=2608891 RepID=UPI003D27CEED